MRCTCRVYDIDKIPCEHALAAAKKRRNISEVTLVHPYYTKNYWCNAYAESISPEDVELESPIDIANKRCLPPDERRGAGRPKKSRYLSALEKAMGKKAPQKKIRKKKLSQGQATMKVRKHYTCSQCKIAGHNRTTCNNI